jgi:hypothetical protein
VCIIFVILPVALLFFVFVAVLLVVLLYLSRARGSCLLLSPPPNWAGSEAVVWVDLSMQLLRSSAGAAAAAPAPAPTLLLCCLQVVSAVRRMRPQMGQHVASWHISACCWRSHGRAIRAATWRMGGWLGGCVPALHALQAPQLAGPCVWSAHWRWPGARRGSARQ